MTPPANISFQYEANPDDKTIAAAAQLYVDLCKDSTSFMGATSGRLDLALPMAMGVLKPLVRVSGELYTARDEDGNLIGFTVWAPPGRTAFDTPEQLEMGFADFLSQIDEEGKEFQTHLFQEILPAWLARDLGIEDAEREYYWCWFAMVREDHHNKGICRVLFDMTYAKARLTGATMALITDSHDNVAKYEKLGFAKRGEQKVTSPYGDWSLWCMSRETKVL
ncbi:hypothetical protein ONZ51_g734 [Trametes cubensis]|uniref:N-acetyltransferase domain-containing protein n=1 Tax=Trametes cubensis TaxID=1111947 RepID=A0AAD7XFI0_9APHY|nr:hypothetical protein ONZ51_g734 [Trametes cubensis]